MATTRESNIDVKILEKAVAPDAPTWSVPVARALASLAFASEQKAEMGRLLDKNNAGTISSGEREVLEGYVRVGNLLSLLRAKARSTLSAKTSKR